MSDFLVPLPLILLGWAIGGGSPGPATLAISSTSMEYGRRNGLLLALGVISGLQIIEISMARAVVCPNLRRA